MRIPSFPRLIARRPWCVFISSVFVILVPLGVFALGAVNGFIEVGADFTSAAFAIEGDHVVDRGRAIRAALSLTRGDPPVTYLLTPRTASTADDFCDDLVPFSGDSADYRGCISTTRGGTPCQRWDSQTPHSHDRTSSNYPDAGLSGNYCRNPDGEPGIWCYTVDPDVRWDFCDIPSSRRRLDSEVVSWQFHKIGQVRIHIEAVDPLTTLFDGDSMFRIGSLFEELLDSEQFQALCKRDHPDAECDYFRGPFSFLRARSSNVSRYRSVQLPTDLSYPPTFPVAPLLAAANTSAGRLKTSVLLTALGVQGGALPDEALALLQDKTTCDIGISMTGDGDPNGEGERTRITLTNCGPMPGCCNCTQEPGCLNLPLCRTVSEEEVTHADTTLTPLPLDAEQLPAHARTLQSALATEVACESGSPLRSILRYHTERAYRHGDTSELKTFLHLIELGGWQDQRLTWSDYQPVHDAAKRLYRATILDLLSRARTFNNENPGLQFSMYTNDENEFVLNHALTAGLLDSAYWSIGGLAVGCVYMSLHLGSPLLTLGATIGLLVSFPLTWFVYAAIFELGDMGVFNFMALFIIIAIGVDDIFVFYDAWKQSAAHATSLEGRMTFAYRRSVFAMAITTITDSAAFFSNTLAVIPVVRQFGIFMGTLVLINFMIVITYFPALIAIRFRCRTALVCSCCCQCGAADRIQAASLQSSAGGDGSTGNVSVPGGANGCDDASKRAQLFPTWPTDFLTRRMLPVLLRVRVAVLLSGLGLFGQAIYCISSLERTDNTFQAESFHPTHNMAMYVRQVVAYEEPPIRTIQMFWGVKGVRRSGQRSISVPVWSETFQPISAAAQREVLRVCNDGRQIEFVHNGGQQCFMQHFADWRIALDGPDGFPSDDFLHDLDLFCVFASHRGYGPGWCDQLASTMNATGSLNETYAELLLLCNAFWTTAATYMSDPNDGHDLPDWAGDVRWSCQLQDVNGFISCRHPSDSDEGFTPALMGFRVSFDVQFSQFGSASSSQPAFDAFEALASETNAHGLPDSSAMQWNRNWLTMRVEELMIWAGLNGAAIALAAAFATLLLALKNWVVALLAVIHVAMVATCNAGAIFWLGWRLGFIEALCLITAIGFSVDFVAHVGIAYSGSTSPTRLGRTEQAMGELGPSIMSGGISTIVVAAFMTQCELMGFYKVGVFMLMSMAISLFYALLVLPMVLVTLGPVSSFGMLPSMRQWQAIAVRLCTYTQAENNAKV